MGLSSWRASLPHRFTRSVHSGHVRFNLTTWFLAVVMLSSQVQAADYEERVPQSAAFDSMANQVVYVDQVTPPGELLPKTSEIWTVFTDGLGKLRLTSGHKDTNPLYSPDAKQILFERDSDGDLWIMNALGDGLRNLTHTPDVYESGAQFSNDGESVFLLTPAPINSTLGQEELAKQPFLAAFHSKVLVELNLKDGSRRQLLDDTYHVQAVMPDTQNDTQVIVLCNRLQENGRPEPFGANALVSVPLKGGIPRPFYTPPLNFTLQKAAVGGKHLVLSITAPGKNNPQTFLLPRTEALTKPVPTDHISLERLLFLGDIGCEGTHVVGTTLGMYERGEKKTGGGLFWHRLELYDIAAGKWSTVIQE